MIILIAILFVIVKLNTAVCNAINSRTETAVENVQMCNGVLARNDKTDEVEEKEVTNTFVEQTCEIVKITVDGEIIETTAGHPFYAEHRGYVAAAQLRAGDILVDVNGEKKVVEKIQHELLEKPINVYNLEVADDHNYYVGKTGVLVHNVGACLKGIQYGKDIAAIVGFAAATGIAIPTILDMLNDGTLTIPKIYTVDIEIDTDVTITELLTDVTEIGKDPPKGLNRIYNFAFIQKNSTGITVIAPSLNLIEATYLALLLIDYESIIKNGLVGLDEEITNDIGKIAKSILNYIYENDIIILGIYTPKQGDARALAYEVMVIGGEFDCFDDMDEWNGKPENHFKVDFPHQIHYNHFHASREKEIHFWYGKRLYAPDKYTVEEHYHD